MSESNEDDWYPLCSIDDLAEGVLKKFEVNDIALVAVRVGDEHRAFPPFCPHMSEPLHESGICSGPVLTCSKHLWQWNLLTGEQQGPAEKALLMYETSVRQAKVWVRVGKELVYDYQEEDEEDDFEW